MLCAESRKEMEDWISALKSVQKWETYEVSLWPLIFNLVNRLLVVLKCQKFNSCISEWVNFCSTNTITHTLILLMYTWSWCAFITDNIAWVYSDGVRVVCVWSQASQFNMEHFSGMHNWYACSHARPTFCNVCREALPGVTSHGLSCEGKHANNNSASSTNINRNNLHSCHYDLLIWFNASLQSVPSFSLSSLVFQCVSSKLINAVQSDPLTTVSGPLWLP